MPSNDKQKDKLDKRAAALKANMQRRKARAKELKKTDKDEKSEKNNDKPTDES